MISPISNLALLSTLLTTTLAAPAIFEKRAAVTGPVIFLSNCVSTSGTSYAEFDYYSSGSTSILSTTSPGAPTLVTPVNPSTSVDYIDGGTFTNYYTETAEFGAIISIDENDFTAVGARVGNGKTTTWFWAQVCYYIGKNAVVYKPSSSVTCEAAVYCVEGPKDTSDL